MKVIVPIGILAIGLAVVAWLVVTRPAVEQGAPDVPAPLVRASTVEPESVQFVVRAHGTVEPRVESQLIPQVSGDVVWVSPNVVPGGFFEAGEPLLRIDRADYAVAVEQSRAALVQAESRFKRASKERQRQRRLADRSAASESRIDDAENDYVIAEAQVREARALLERAERDLARTEFKAPYAGRVRNENVDVGQFATRGQSLGRIYAVDWAEVRLPLPDRELAYLDLSLSYRPTASPGASGEAAGAEADARDGPRAPDVLLSAEFAGRPYTWRGRIVRTEGELDPKSRMVNVVARVEDPYGRSEYSDRPPLSVGLFVEADIMGHTVADAIVLPRSALRSDARGQKDRVLVIDDDDRLRYRAVEVLRAERERVIIGGGLVAGERVCTSPLRAVTDGMRVRIAEQGVAPELARAAR